LGTATNKIIEQNELLTLIPHKGKMFLLNRVILYDLETLTLTAEADILPSCMFFDAKLNGIPSWVSFEFMAQSISALSGIKGRANGKPVMPGFILSISNLNIETPAMQRDETARITVRQDCIIDSTFTFEGEVAINNNIIATALITAAEIPFSSVIKDTK
jgi:predicted hotdog family 3-hydroxylacyl-ACP dehydratase